MSETIASILEEGHLRQVGIEKTMKFARELHQMVMVHIDTTGTHLNDIEKIVAVVLLAGNLETLNKKILGEDVLNMINNIVEENTKRKDNENGNKSN